MYSRICDFTLGKESLDGLKWKLKAWWWSVVKMLEIIGRKENFPCAVCRKELGSYSILCHVHSCKVRKRCSCSKAGWLV